VAGVSGGCPRAARDVKDSDSAASGKGRWAGVGPAIVGPVAAGAPAGRAAAGRGEALRWLAGLPLVVVAGAWGLEALDLDFGPAGGDGWRVEHGALSLSLPAVGGGALAASLTGLELPPPLDDVRTLEIRCAATTEAGDTFRCPHGELQVGLGGGAPTTVEGPFSLEVTPTGVRVKVGPVPSGAGALSFALHAAAGGWDADAMLDRVPLGGAGALPLPVTLISEPVRIAGGTLSGRVALRADRDGLGAEVDVQAEMVEFSDETGLRAGEGVAVSIGARAQGQRSGWSGDARLSLDAGQVYLHPVFVSWAEHPLEARLSGRWSAAAGAFELERAEVEQAGVGRLGGAAVLAGADRLDVRSWRAAAENLVLAAVYRLYLQPFLVGTPAGGLELSGRAGASVSWSEQAPREARLQLESTQVEHAEAGFSAHGMEGVLHWREGEEPGASRLGWAGAQAFGIDLGPGEAHGTLGAGGFVLARPLRVKVLDGALTISDLHLERSRAGGTRWELAAALDGLSLERLTNTLAWPEFGGAIGGMVPRVHYADGVLGVDGAIEVEVFDGRVSVGGLRLERPLGPAPVLTADVELERLSLHALTRAFSFGNIEGSLSGRIHRLRLEDWTPTAFDAVFATPEDDPVRHRISQRAVDNLASLGGAGAVLSGTFLRIFREFSYDRLGLSCRLRRGVCLMGGVAPAPSGYHIVVGGGLPPRIDVIGYNDKVSWSTLVHRLKAVTLGDQPVVR
jgi:hypothetical protein